MFAVVNNEDFENILEYNSEELGFEKELEEEGRVFGEYRYEKEAQFGTASTAEDTFVYDTETELFGLINNSDSPSHKRMFRVIREDVGVGLYAPEYPASTSHEFYREYGFSSGFSVSFCRCLKKYELNSGCTTVNPEDKAENILMDTNRTNLEDVVGEVVEELIDDGLYVDYMRVDLEEDPDDRVKFTNPLGFLGFSRDSGREKLHLLCERAGEFVE